jgi:ABC-type multidrug transport system permease subunit
MASYITSLTLIEDRRSGVWNRTLTAGATPLEFLISHLILGSSIMMIQAIEFIVYTIFIGNNGHTMRFLVSVSTFVILLGFSGTLFGLCISAITDSVLVATYISLVLTLPLLFLSGEFLNEVQVRLFLKFKLDI